MAQRFKAKTLLSNSGVFNNEVVAPNLVYNTGNQTISGDKTFSAISLYDPNDRMQISIYPSGEGSIAGPFIGSNEYLTIAGFNRAQNINLNEEYVKITAGSGASSIEVNYNGSIYLNGKTVGKTGTFEKLYADNLVYKTGDQTISGIKTFATGVNISGHVGIGINNNDKFGLYVRKSAAGVTVNPDAGSIAVFEGSGNSHITVLASNAQTAGVVLGSPADNFGSYLSWNHDNSALKLATAKTSGFIQILTNDENEAVRITRSGDVGIGTISPSEKLQVVGNILANNLVYNTGNQSISGNKTFVTGIVAPNLVYNTGEQFVSGLKQFDTRPTVNGTGVLLSGEAASLPTTIVYTTGNQTISGVKTFQTGVVVSGNLQVSGSGIFNSVDLNNVDTLSLSGVNVTITNGNIALTNRPTVNGTGVLLSGSTPFVMNFGHVRHNTTAGDQRHYFGPPIEISPVSLANNEKRRVQILQDCFLRKIVWTSLSRDNAPTPSNAMTGYFKNFGNNALTDDPSSGIQVTSAINIPSTNTMYSNSTGTLNIPITGGNYVSFYYQSNFNAGSNNQASGLGVNVYAYFE